MITPEQTIGVHEVTEKNDTNGNREDIWRKALMATQDRLAGNKTGPKLGTGGKLNDFDKSSQKH